MTIKEALKSDVSYPIPDAFFDKTFITRGLKGSDEFTQEIGVSKSYRLAYADCLKRHITAVNMSEYGLSVSLADRDKIVNIANGIYGQYGEPLLQTESEPTIEYIGEDWNDWD